MQPLIAKISVLGVLCLHFITPVFSTGTVTSMDPMIDIEVLHNDLNIADLPRLVNTNEAVAAYVKQYTLYGKRETEAILGRAMVYFPVFEKALADHQLPESLKFLPIVESGLYTEIVSSRGAAGLWQFMPATARHYGLLVNENVDERLDIEKSSKAAAVMLAELMDRFGDWRLALAAYNCGPGRVRKATRKAKSQDFNQIREYLPKQTQNYIDKFLAVCYVGQNFNTHGLAPKIPLDLEIRLQAKVLVKGAFSLQELATAGRTTVEALLALNPHFTSTTNPIHLAEDVAVPLFAQADLQCFLAQESKPTTPEILSKFLKIDWQSITSEVVQKISSSWSWQQLQASDSDLKHWARVRKSWINEPQSYLPSQI